MRSILLSARFALILLSLATLPAATLADEGSYVFWNDPSSSSGFLGVHVEEEIEHEEGGARITRVVRDSPADKAGLERGDIIVELDGQPVRGPKGLTHRLKGKEPEDQVQVVILREGDRRSFDVELQKRSRGLTVIAPDSQGRVRFFGRRVQLGVQLSPITPELREHLGGTQEAGILISKVLSGTPAEGADLRVGDLIVAIDGEPIDSPGDIRRAIADKSGDSVEVEIRRDGASREVEVSFPDSEDDRPTGPRASSREERRLERAAYREARRATRSRHVSLL